MRIAAAVTGAGAIAALALTPLVGFDSYVIYVAGPGLLWAPLASAWGLLAFAGVFAFVSESALRAKLRFDAMGFLLLGGAIGALQMMLDRGERVDWDAFLGATSRRLTGQPARSTRSCSKETRT